MNIVSTLQWIEYKTTIQSTIIQYIQVISNASAHFRLQRCDKRLIMRWSSRRHRTSKSDRKTEHAIKLNDKNRNINNYDEQQKQRSIRNAYLSLVIWSVFYWFIIWSLSFNLITCFNFRWLLLTSFCVFGLEMTIKSFQNIRNQTIVIILCRLEIWKTRFRNHKRKCVNIQMEKMRMESKFCIHLN